MTEHVTSGQILPDEQMKRQRIIQTEEFQPKFAGFWVRLWALLIDLLIISSISGIFIKPLFRVMDIAIEKPFMLLFSPYKLAALLLLLLYFILMTKFAGQTVGKMILGIRVVSKDGERLTWGTVFFREGIGRFISHLLWIPYVIVPFMPKKEALHDFFADTFVIHEQSFEKRLVNRTISDPDSQRLQEDPSL